MIVAFARLELRVAHSRSLKDKRRVARSIRDKVKSKFDVRVAEVGGQDTWQSLEVGFAMVGTDTTFIAALLDKVVRFIEDESGAELIAEYRDSIYYGDDSELALARSFYAGIAERESTRER